MAQSVCFIGGHPGLSVEGGLEGVGKMGSSQEEAEQLQVEAESAKGRRDAVGGSKVMGIWHIRNLKDLVKEVKQQQTIYFSPKAAFYSTIINKWFDSIHSILQPPAIVWSW